MNLTEEQQRIRAEIRRVQAEDAARSLETGKQMIWVLLPILIPLAIIVNVAWAWLRGIL